MIKQVYILILFTCSFAQTDALSKAIYFGWGMGPNIGGEFGVGFEQEFARGLSFNIAIGSFHPDALKENSKYSSFGFDLGIKYYVWSNLYIGANYGLIDYRTNTLYTNGEEISDFEEKSNGFSISIGYKAKISKKVYLSLYMANWLDSEKKSNGNKMTDDIVKKYDSSIRFGLMFGYSL